MKVATLNICIFPLISQNIFKDNKKLRIDEIIDTILKYDIEILCIQELFCKKMINYIQNHKIILENGYKLYYQDGILYNRTGLAILSKYDMETQEFVRYNGFNCIGKILRDPYFQIVKLKTNDKSLYVINCHSVSPEYYFCNRKTFLDDNNKNRKTIENFCQQLDKQNNYFLLCGDFNCNNFYINNDKNIPYYMNSDVGVTLNLDSYLSFKKLHEINVCDYILSNSIVKNTEKIRVESDHFMIYSEIF